MKTYKILFLPKRKTPTEYRFGEHAYINACDIHKALSEFLTEHRGCEVVSIELA